MKLWKKRADLEENHRSLEGYYKQQRQLGGLDEAGNVRLDTFYSVMINLIENIKVLLDEVQGLENTGSGNKESEVLILDLAGEIDALNETISWIVEMPFQKMRFKQVFEALDDSVAELDNLIEDLNEVYTNETLSYIEDWDVSFFLEQL